MPQIVIRNRRPASNQPTFTPTPDHLLPLADPTTGNITLPASLGSTVLTPGQSVTKTYGFLPAADFASLLSMARAGQVNFPGSTNPNIPRGLRLDDQTFCLNFEEPLNPREGDSVFSIADGKVRRFDGVSWNTDDFDSWKHVTVTPTPVARAFHRAIEMDTGEIMLLGGGTGYASGALTATIPAGKTNAGQAGALCQRLDPATGILRDACPMPSNNVGVSLGGRFVALYQKLPDGRIWAGGGTNFDINVGAFFTDPTAVFSDFWIYDPVADDWTAAASSPETISPMSQFVTLNDGTLLVAGFQSPSSTTWPGGANATSLTKQRFFASLHTYVWDWRTDTWTQKGDLNQRHYFSPMVVLDSGKVMIVAGWQDFQMKGLGSHKCEIYDPGTGLWTYTADMPAIADEESTTVNVIGPAALTSLATGASVFGTAASPMMSVRVNGLVPTQKYVGGTLTLSGTTNSTTGTGDSFAKSGSIMTLTDAAATFLTTAATGVPLNIAGATSGGNNGNFIVLNVISNTQITYVNASGVAEAYAGTWTLKRNDGSYTISQVVQDTVGGFTRIYYYNEAGLNQAGAGGTYQVTEVTPGARNAPSASAIPGNKVMVAGGNRPPCHVDSSRINSALQVASGTYTDLVPNSNAMRSSTIIYDADTNTWQRAGNMKFGRDYARAAKLEDGKVIVVGGMSFNFGGLSTCEIFDPARGEWTDGALFDPVLDGNGNPTMFQGFAGNPHSGVSPSPGFIVANSIAGSGNNVVLARLKNGRVVACLGMASWNSVGTRATGNRVSFYTPGTPALTGNLRRIP